MRVRLFFKEFMSAAEPIAAAFAAGLYTNNRFGTEWLVLFGAACCGITAGVFWMVCALQLRKVRC